ncbi:MAG: hypothetical protein EAZ44_11075, partial [Cytophagia bacterium]
MDYQPIDCSFHDILLDNATKKKYHKIQYFTNLHEFITTDSIIKDVFTENKEEFLVLICNYYFFYKTLIFNILHYLFVIISCKRSGIR